MRNQLETTEREALLVEDAALIRVFGQPILEALPSREVSYEAVDPGLAEQDARHRDAHFPATRERADIAVDPHVVEAEAGEHFARLALEGVAAEMFVLLLDLAEAGQDRVRVGRPRRVGHCVLKVLQFVMEIAKATAAGDRFVEHASAGHLLDVLPKVSQRHASRDRHLTVIGRLLAGDHPEQRRLAGAVRPDQADLVARVELERRIDEEKLLAVVLGDTVYRDHRLRRGLFSTGRLADVTTVATSTSRRRVTVGACPSSRSTTCRPLLDMFRCSIMPR